jgi:multicomponent Na+:H+ antiporter subunit B
MTATVLEAVLLAFVLGCALGAAVLKDVLASVIAFAAYSLGVSVIWVVLQAPDVGLTEAAVGAGIMTTLFLLALANTVRPSHDRFFERIQLRTALGVGLFVVVMAATVPSLPEIGSAAPVSTGEVTAYYLENAYKETQVHNAVTAVLAAYRGFDTLGEAVVVFAAGAAAMGVLRREVFA